MPNFTFCEGRKQGMSDKTYFLIMNLDMADGNSVGIITIVTEKCEFTFHATFSWLSAVVAS